MLTLFDPQPARLELPERFPDPFAEEAPHPLARRAAEALRRRLESGELGDLRGLRGPGLGKMFGVLVVAAADGRSGYLCGFSGMLEGRWEVEGFVPPLFDLRQREAFWPAVEAELDAVEERLQTLAADPTQRAVTDSLEALERSHGAERAELRERHELHRAQRHAQRRGLENETPAARQAPLAELAHRSRLDEEEGRALRRRQAQERDVLLGQQRALDAERAALEGARAERSRRVWREIGEHYLLRNAAGEVRSVGSLYAPAEVPGGAGDCAGPKLLGWAYAHALRPLALAEFWWGAPPLTGGRSEGAYYPACRRRCGVVLPFMLQGLGPR